VRRLRAVHADRVDELVQVAEWLIAFGRLLIGDAEHGVFAHWSTILVLTLSERASMHPGCRQVTALLA